MNHLQPSLVFVDLETTGANAAGDRITEIGIVEVSEQGVSEWSTLVNPETPIPEFIARLTGISNAMVETAPRFEDIAAEVLERLKGRLFVAHNVRFDYGFLRHEFKRLGIDFRSDVLCTVKLSRKLFPQHHKHNLGALVERHQLPVESRHRALADARAIHAFWVKIHAELPSETIQATLGELLQAPSLPAGLDPSVLDDLPETHGVYLFHGDNDIPLYVGKGANIRRGVLSHFTAGYKQDKRMQLAEEIRRIEWIETAGELGALLTESRLIKTLQPIHNRQLRRNRELCAWKLERGENNGMTVRLVRAQELDFGSEPELYGLFPSQKKAVDSLREIAQAHHLCLIQLQLETPPQGKSSSCSAYQLKNCKGLCIGKEPAGQHDIRLISALARMKVQTWPFPGPVGIRETASWGGLTEIHLVDRWCYLGSGKSERDMQELLGQQPVFDLDTYKILNRLFSHGKPDVILIETVEQVVVY